MEEHLKKHYDNSVQATDAIMKAHVSAGTIPDPHQHPMAALVVLRAHASMHQCIDQNWESSPSINILGMVNL